jgi:hypothetical protein
VGAAIVFVALGILAACVPPHGPAIPALPGKGGPAWSEVTSEHFILWTDAPAARGRALVRQMENHRQVVIGVALDNAKSKAKSFVIALRDAEEVAAYIPSRFVAYSWGGSPVRQPVIVIAADTDDHDNHIITHELTHVITWGVIPNQPHWFAEGIAGYFETAKLGAGGATVDVGQPLDYIVARLRDAQFMSTASLFACREIACIDDMFYAKTWALFSFLVNEHPVELRALMQRLVELPVGQEFTGGIPRLPQDQLDRDLATWLAHGRLTVLHYKVKLEDWPVAVRPLADADALAARGLLRFMFAKTAPETRAELTAAVTADPTNLLGWLVLTSLTGSMGITDARATAKAHPEDWRAWWLLGFAVQHGPEAAEAREKLCALVANDPSAAVPGGICQR